MWDRASGHSGLEYGYHYCMLLSLLTHYCDAVLFVCVDYRAHFSTKAVSFLLSRSFTCVSCSEGGSA